MKSDTERACARRDVEWLRQLLDAGDWDEIFQWGPALADRYTFTEERDTYHPLGAAWQRPERATARIRYQHIIADGIEHLSCSQDPSHWSWTPTWDRIGDLCRRLEAIERMDRIESNV